METNITPKVKDQILNTLKNFHGGAIDYKEECLKYDLNFLEYGLIIDQFAEMNLIDKQGFMGGGAIITAKANLHDFISHGGFEVQEEILKANINKLGLELELLSKELEPKYLEKIKNISDIGKNILSVLPFFSN